MSGSGRSTAPRAPGTAVPLRHRAAMLHADRAAKRWLQRIRTARTRRRHGGPEFHGVRQRLGPGRPLGPQEGVRRRFHRGRAAPEPGADSTRADRGPEVRGAPPARPQDATGTSRTAARATRQAHHGQAARATRQGTSRTAARATRQAPHGRRSARPDRHLTDSSPHDPTGSSQTAVRSSPSAPACASVPALGRTGVGMHLLSRPALVDMPLFSLPVLADARGAERAHRAGVADRRGRERRVLSRCADEGPLSRAARPGPGDPPRRRPVRTGRPARAAPRGRPHGPVSRQPDRRPSPFHSRPRLTN
ncbi:hypothetical protein P3T26_000570 [Streptomyces sp. MAA16]|nr:hypothetical protein [Streptomyces sp. MAA16]